MQKNYSFNKDMGTQAGKGIEMHSENLVSFTHVQTNSSECFCFVRLIE